MMTFNGPVYDAARDGERLSKQHERILSVVQDGRWRTIDQIVELTGDPANSVSAQLRHLRKARFGSWTVDKRHLGSGLYEYRVWR